MAGKKAEPAGAPGTKPIDRAESRQTELVDIGSLKPHPRNYRTHPADQLRHIAESLRQHGFYRNVVVSKDGMILAGHGVVQAAQLGGLKQVPIFRLPVDADSPAALKILAGDNELGRFAEVDDRALTELLKEIQDVDVDGLLGTGYDETQLAALTMVTRPASEIASLDEALEWVGMPEYAEGERQIKLVVTFSSEEERSKFVDEHKMRVDRQVQGTWGVRWPLADREDVAGVKFEPAAPPAPEPVE